MLPRRLNDTDEQEAPQIGVIMRLLSEHTGKVQALVDRRDQLRSQRLVRLNAAVVGIFVGVSGILWSLDQFVFTKGGFVSTQHGITSVFPIVVILFSLLMILLNALTTDSRRERQLRRDVIMAGRRLERVVRVAVQLSEHGLADDLGTRLELELQIAEAQAVLTYADPEHDRPKIAPSEP